ncbi:hypothetical protein CDD83_3283 [Cordyceps sp. RAO-2017]|nr:hypothetical protein CDD83_3283 [Cordyceps sp. RAO-2017]
MRRWTRDKRAKRPAADFKARLLPHKARHKIAAKLANLPRRGRRPTLPAADGLAAWRLRRARLGSDGQSNYLDTKISAAPAFGSASKLGSGSCSEPGLWSRLHARALSSPPATWLIDTPFAKIKHGPGIHALVPGSTPAACHRNTSAPDWEETRPGSGCGDIATPPPPSQARPGRQSRIRVDGRGLIVNAGGDAASPSRRLPCDYTGRAGAETIHAPLEAACRCLLGYGRLGAFAGPSLGPTASFPAAGGTPVRPRCHDDGTEAMRPPSDSNSGASERGPAWTLTLCLPLALISRDEDA